MAADTATAPSARTKAAGRALQVPLRPRDRRVPRHRQAHRPTWPWPCWRPSSSTTPTYTQTGVTPNILVSYHMSFSFYVWIVVISNAIGAFASLPAVQDRPARAVQRRHLRTADHRPAGRRRRPALQDRVAVRHGHLRARPGRGRHPGGHPGPGPRLQPPARPGLGHGLLDRRPGGRQPDHLASSPPTRSTRSSRTTALDAWKSQFIISGRARPSWCSCWPSSS